MANTNGHRSRATGDERVDSTLGGLGAALRSRSAVSLAALAVAFAAPQLSYAQTTDAAAAAEAAALADAEVEGVIVTGEALDTYDVLPDRPTDGVFGTNRTLVETPRSVTLIESSLIDLFGIRSVNDFVSITPGAFTGNYFGVAGALDIRGERADNFFRGFRRIENRGNFPTAVGASEYIEVVKGPPPIIYGGGKVGGVLNFFPKSSKSKKAARLSEPTAAVNLTYGTYDKRLASAEFGAPFSIAGKESGVYIYAQHEDSLHYYNNIYNKGTLLQVSFNTELSNTVRLEYGGMYQHANLNQSLGWNRVTQELIDSDGKKYLGGQPALYLDTNRDGFLQPSEVGRYSLEQFAFANPFPYGALTANQQAAFALDPSTVGYRPISHRTVQAEKIDFSKSDVYTGFFDIIYAPNEDWNIKNQTFYDTIDHTKYSSYGFTADYNQYVLENKTTVTGHMKFGDMAVVEPVVGFSWRKSNGRERESRGRGYQVLDRRDISRGPTANDRFEGAYTGTGNVPYNWDEDGQHTDTGVFAVIDAKFGDYVSLIAGGRADSYKVSVYGTDVNGVYGKAADKDTAYSYNLSANYTMMEDINLYGTYATSDYIELGQGGIVARENIEGKNWTQSSKLKEVGLKGYAYDRRIYFDVAYYDQNKSAFNTLSGGFDSYKSHGVEAEVRVAATKQINFTGSATFQKTTLLNAPFFLGVPPGVLGLDPVKTYGGRFVAVGDLIGFKGPLEAPTPKRVFSFNATYKADAGWGASLGATYVSAMNAGYTGAIRLPAYTVARGALFWDIGKVSLRLNANNLFNEKYYTPQFLFWDTFISPSVGRTAEFTVAYKW